MSEPPQGKPDGARVESSAWGPFSIGFTDVTAVAFIALGLVLFEARGAAPGAFVLGGLTYLLVGLGYTELGSAYPIAGGAQQLLVRGLGDPIGFLAGAALLFDFTISLALFAVAAVAQLDFLVAQPGGGPLTPAVASAGMLALLAILHLAGVKPRPGVGRLMAAVGLAACAALVIAGFSISWRPAAVAAQWRDALARGSSWGHGMTLTLLSFAGIESIAQAAHQTRRSATMIPRASLTLLFCVFMFAVLLPTLATGVGPSLLFANPAPLPSLAGALPAASVVAPAMALVGIVLCLLAATRTLAAIGRLLEGMGRLRLARVGSTKIPLAFVSLLAAAAVAAASLTDRPLALLADLYGAGVTFGYVLLLVALIRLRFAEPLTPRPYKLPFNLPWRGRSLPLVALLGLFALVVMFSTVMATHALARLVAPAWLGAAFLYYIISRRSQKLPLFGSTPRNWVEELLACLAATEDLDLLEQYKRAMAEREKARTP